MEIGGKILELIRMTERCAVVCAVMKFLFP